MKSAIMMQMNNLILYTTNCPKCRVLKTKLDLKKIPYDVCTDIDEMLALGFTAAPILKTETGIMTFEEAVNWLKEVKDAN